MSDNQKLDNMEEVSEGSNVVTKNAKPAEKIDTSGSSDSLGGSGKKVVHVDTDSLEGAAGTKNAGKSAANSVSVEKDKSLKTKPSDASSKQEEVENDEEVIQEEPETKYDFTEDVDALVAGEELSEEFRARAVTIFEAAVTSKVNEELKIVQQAFDETLTEETEKIKTELAEKVDDYISYAAKTWLEENALAVEHGIKVEMSESFFAGLKELFVEHNMSVPEEKFNLLDGMVGELDEMEAKLNEQIDANVALNKRVGQLTRMEIVTECSAGLAETQREKLASLAEGVEFETEEDFRNKVETIKESYFARKEATEVADPTEDKGEPLVEDTNSTSMSKYVDALSNWSK